MKAFRPIISILVLAVALAACTPATAVVAPATATNPPAATEPPAATLAAPTPVPTVAPTATLAPTATEAPTATAAPTLAPTAIPADEQARAWCILKDRAMSVKASDDPAVMPEGATAATLEKGTLVLLKPATACTFVFNLGKPVEGMELQVLDGFNNVWLKAPVQAAANNRGVAVIKHAYFVEPPFWMVDYKLQLAGTDGAVAWSSPVEIRNSWMPAKCWDSTMPNFQTLRCKNQQDLHPWDPAYTPPPPEPKTP